MGVEMEAETTDEALGTCELCGEERETFAYGARFWDRDLCEPCIESIEDGEV